MMSGSIITFTVIFVMVPVVFLCYRDSRRRNKQLSPKSKHIVLEETEDSRKITASIRKVMVETYKKAFDEKNIEDTVRTISGTREFVWPQKEKEDLAEYFEEEFDDTKVVVFQKDMTFDVTVIYLHGGAYLYEITDLHAEFCLNIATNTRARVVVPHYRHLPDHHCSEAYAMLSKLYRYCLMFGKPIILAGDSSGGGLALGFYQYCISQNLTAPRGVILISPWLDASLSNPQIREIEWKDMMLAGEGLRILGRIWAGEYEIKDPRVSPIYGDLNNLPETLVFAGTDEIMHPDSLMLYEKTKDDSPVTLIEGKGLYHVFALSDMTEQGRICQKMMVEMIQRIEKQYSK